MTSARSPRSGLHVALVAGLAFIAILLGVLGMHASMVGAHGVGPEHAMAIDEPAPAVHASSAHAGSAHASASDPPHPMGGMGDLDCLLFGMLCSLGAVALAVLGILLRRPAAALRPLALPRGRPLIAPLTRPPLPPSLDLLSISRT
ncbi:hypothetical protein [uncultured Amnibacterium sp.]|uniref:hypothetical protein n=1 Tax=uncultured Amnibacterium sp. TaxID=1631851 RepID=UPI0035CB24B0